MSSFAHIRKVYIYTRVSTKKQIAGNSSELGLAMQENLLLDLFKELFPGKSHEDFDLELVSDIGSSFNDQGSLVNLDSLVEVMPEHTLILIHDVSRLGRNVYQVMKNVYEPVELKKSLIYSMIDRKTFGVSRVEDLDFFKLTVESEGFSAVKSDMAIRRNKRIKAMGGYVGGVPYGKTLVRFGDVRKLAQNRDEAISIKKILSLSSEGKTPKEISNFYRKLEFADPARYQKYLYRGRPLNVSLIKRVLARHSEPVQEMSGLQV